MKLSKGVQISCNNLHYTLTKNIGSGGSGEVWKAESGNEVFAIKFIKSDDKNKITRFQKEVSFCKQYRHQNIISVLGSGKFNDRPYYIMPYCNSTLKDIIKQNRNAEDIIRNILQICYAIKFIHKKNVTHRDIKPENILSDGRNMILSDFGISHFKDSTLTKKNDLLANRNYAAPEQRIKGNANNITKASDIYAFGMVIHECFTKDTPMGSDFQTVESKHPLYFEFDVLVKNMIKQDSRDRLSIEDVILEIKTIQNRIQENLRKRKCVFAEQIPKGVNIQKKVLSEIIVRASQDVFFAKNIFERHPFIEIGKYNPNWHKKISYSADDFLFNLYVQNKLLGLCERKYEYESEYYKRKDFQLIHLATNPEVFNPEAMYKKMRDILSRYPVRDPSLDLSGQILKTFASCFDYHRNEVLEQVDSILERGKHDLNDAPILWIVSALKAAINEKSVSEIKFQDHIAICWHRTKTYLENDDDSELTSSAYLAEETKVLEILTEFQTKWRITFSKINDRYYVIKFPSHRGFSRFRQYALKVSRQYYFFEGDVLEMVDEYNNVSGIIEIKLSEIFDIQNTLAKILGLRDIDEQPSRAP